MQYAKYKSGSPLLFFSVRKVSYMLKVKASWWKVLRGAKKAEFLMWERMKTAPSMTRAHKENLLKWAFEQVMYISLEWRYVVLSDEKKFNPKVIPTTGMIYGDE